MTARLVPLTEGSIVITLEKAITLIGRHPDCDAVLDENQKISRRHCCIAQVEHRLVLRDLGSMNGVQVNGQQVVEVDLQEGDEVTIGDEEFVLELSTTPQKKARRAERVATPQSPDKRAADKRAPQNQSLENRPHERPNRVADAPLPKPQRTPVALTPADISREYPIALPDEMDDAILLDFAAPIPETPVNGGPASVSSSNMTSGGPVTPEARPDPRLFELDSGELKLDDLDNLHRRKK